jgi:hypothetical protein
MRRCTLSWLKYHLQPPVPLTKTTLRVKVSFPPINPFAFQCSSTLHHMASRTTLPDVPVKHADFVSYVESHPNTPLLELLEPYKQYDGKLREVFAQEPDHPALTDKHLNVVPVFNGHTSSLKIRARDLDSESQEEKERYIMPLKAHERRPNDSPAIVQDIKDFQQNFALFCESSLVDLDWSNVVAAGSSVVTCLLPVPKQHSKSKRALRQYYHETIAPASDVDLFIYGLNEEEAVKKIIEIEKKIKDSILTETTTIRTKNAITIASQYPTRHIQIVLRIYKSVSEILTGFDVDCSCAAYDGKQVWAAPRALTAYMTQSNTIDLTRRSPSYESRLSKYSHRGFEVYWPLLERSRVDPTIFERNFGRTVGLARLLVLERLPTKSEREAYTDERRRERGRPTVYRHRYFSGDNIKDQHEDEVAEWVEQVSTMQNPMLELFLTDNRKTLATIIPSPYPMVRSTTPRRLRSSCIPKTCSSIRSGTSPRIARSICTVTPLSSGLPRTSSTTAADFAPSQ